MSQTQPEFTAEDVLNAYRVEDKPVEVPLPDGRKLLFSPLPNTKARKQLDAAISDFLGKIPGVEDKGHSAHFIKNFPRMEYAEMRISAEIHLRAINPAFPPEVAFALHSAPTIIEQIKDKLNTADKELNTLWMLRQIEEAKKKSPTLTPDGDSASVEGNSRGDIPTT